MGKPLNEYTQPEFVEMMVSLSRCMLDGPDCEDADESIMDLEVFIRIVRRVDWKPEVRLADRFNTDDQGISNKERLENAARLGLSGYASAMEAMLPPRQQWSEESAKDTIGINLGTPGEKSLHVESITLSCSCEDSSAARPVDQKRINLDDPEIKSSLMDALNRAFNDGMYGNLITLFSMCENSPVVRGVFEEFQRKNQFYALICRAALSPDSSDSGIFIYDHVSLIKAMGQPLKFWVNSKGYNINPLGGVDTFFTADFTEGYKKLLDRVWNYGLCELSDDLADFQLDILNRAQEGETFIMNNLHPDEIPLWKHLAKEQLEQLIGVPFQDV